MSCEALGRRITDDGEDVEQELRRDACSDCRRKIGRIGRRLGRRRGVEIRGHEAKSKEEGKRKGRRRRDEESRNDWRGIGIGGSVSV